MWNYAVNKKSVKQSRLCFMFFKAATFCFDDSSARSWRPLSQIHEVVTWNGSPTVLKEFPEVLSARWLLGLHSAVQLISKPSQLG